MLELRQSCENCDKPLPPNSSEALICSFECTFCKDCVENILQNVCPNCGGGFEKRPVRPLENLKKYPASADKIYKPIDKEKFQILLKKNKDISPSKR